MTDRDPVNRAYRTLLEKNDLPLGTSLGNSATWQLYRAEVFDRFQYNLGPYQLDYAWPDLKVNLEIDGIYHRLPGAGDKDAQRDRDLRARGWLVFRVDDGDTFEDQLVRVCRTIHILADDEQIRRVNGNCGPREWSSTKAIRKAARAKVHE